MARVETCNYRVIISPAHDTQLPSSKKNCRSWLTTLGRGETRRRDVELRRALGGTQWKVVSRVLVERGGSGEVGKWSGDVSVGAGGRENLI